MTPEEIVITRNTSESNNLVSNGLDLKAGDEVVIFSDNHPSNNQAWLEKSKRFGFTVSVVEQKNPHPGRRVLHRRVHQGDDAHGPRSSPSRISPTPSATCSRPRRSARPLECARRDDACSTARRRSGSFDVNLREIDPDFYSGSAHKWPCGARECGVLFINSRVHDRIWPSSYSAYPGAVGISRRMEMFGQRDEATMIAFAEALAFQTKVGRAAIEQRSKALAQQLLAGLREDRRVPQSSRRPTRRATGAVVTFAPGTLEPRKLVAALYEKDKIGVTTGGGAGRSGIRVSPHFYNTPQEIDRLLARVDAVSENRGVSGDVATKNTKVTKQDFQRSLRVFVPFVATWSTAGTSLPCARSGT